ncbi:hypothetical protein H5410_053689 [Solanum commersonii]|uniref:Uncharacterized protein n=1 Tax=Solanum commersonii TaxID=4109 RepID=A0A9J5X743_SOLCO|nr:hypothetical protein H5410_053689 [Solanum commersonii]
MGQIMRAFDSMLMSNLTNGMKVGESAIYNFAEKSAQIRFFRRMAFPSQDINSDFSSKSANYSRELSEHVLMKLGLAGGPGSARPGPRSI